MAGVPVYAFVGTDTGTMPGDGIVDPLDTDAVGETLPNDTVVCEEGCELELLALNR